MPTAREAFAAAVVSGKLYAFGGRQNGNAIATGHVYDPGTNSWTSRAAMPQPRVSSNGAGVINGIVYVPGGHNGDGIYTKSLYAYNPATNTWSHQGLACRRPSAAAGAACWAASCMSTAPAGPTAARWRASMRTTRSPTAGGAGINAPILKFPAMAAVNGKLYLAGGQDQFGSPSNAAERL